MSTSARHAEAPHLFDHLLRHLAVEVSVVTQDRIDHHERIGRAEALDKAANDLDLSGRTHIARVDRIKRDAELFPLINDARHLFGEIEEGKVRVLRVIGENRGGQRNTR